MAVLSREDFLIARARARAMLCVYAGLCVFLCVHKEYWTCPCYLPMRYRTRRSVIVRMVMLITFIIMFGGSRELANLVSVLTWMQQTIWSQWERNATQESWGHCWKRNYIPIAPWTEWSIKVDCCQWGSNPEVATLSSSSYIHVTVVVYVAMCDLYFLKILLYTMLVQTIDICNSSSLAVLQANHGSLMQMVPNVARVLFDYTYTTALLNT